MKKADKLTLAQELFVRLGKTQKDVAQAVGVTEKTIAAWKVKYNWEALRTAELTGPTDLAGALFRQIQLITEAATSQNRPINLQEADQIAKLSSSIEKLQGKATLGLQSQIMEEFVLYLNEIDADLAKSIVPHQFSFLQSQAKKMVK